MERHFPVSAKDLRHADGIGGSLHDVAELATDVLKSTVTDAQELLKPKLEAAEETLGKAANIVIDKIKERPVTAALTAAGIGLVVGVLLTRRK